jgi:hypothetical protein
VILVIVFIVVQAVTQLIRAAKVVDMIVYGAIMDIVVHNVINYQKEFL